MYPKTCSSSICVERCAPMWKTHGVRVALIYNTGISLSLHASSHHEDFTYFDLIDCGQYKYIAVLCCPLSFRNIGLRNSVFLQED